MKTQPIATIRVKGAALRRLHNKAIAKCNELRREGRNAHDAMYSGFIAEYALQEALTVNRIDWSEPGYYEDDDLRTDLGDLRIDGKIYDVKTSEKYDNISIKPRGTRIVDVHIDYYVHTTIRYEQDEYGRNIAILRVYGIVPKSYVDNKEYFVDRHQNQLNFKRITPKEAQPVDWFKPHTMYIIKQ